MLTKQMTHEEYEAKYMILSRDSITTGDLFDYLKTHIDKYGRNGEVWQTASEKGLSSPCVEVVRLNLREGDNPPISDVVLEWNIE